jgi:hypothetical protein
VGALAGLLLLAAGRALPAQDPPPPAPPPAVPDTLPIARPLKPLPAFFMSLVVPGWAQARLDRKLTAGLFIAFEGVVLGMTMKTARELGYLQRIGADSTRLADKRNQRQDWLILLAFTHLFSGLEAFVSTQLHDFPGDVRFRAVPRGFGAEVALPIRLR